MQAAPTIDLNEHAALIRQVSNAWYREIRQRNRGSLPFDAEDAYQEVWLALMTCAAPFDPAKGSISTYIRFYGTQRLRDYGRRQLGRAHQYGAQNQTRIAVLHAMSLDAPMPNTNDLRPSDWIGESDPEPEDHDDLVVDLDRVQAHLALVKPRLGVVFTMLRSGAKYAPIAEAIGVSESRVAQLVGEALRIARRHLEDVA